MTVSRLESNQIICQQSLNQPNWTRLHLSADAEKEALKTLRITDLKYIPNMQLKLVIAQYIVGSTWEEASYYAKHIDDEKKQIKKGL